MQRFGRIGPRTFSTSKPGDEIHTHLLIDRALAPGARGNDGVAGCRGVDRARPSAALDDPSMVDDAGHPSSMQGVAAVGPGPGWGMIRAWVAWHAPRCFHHHDFDADEPGGGQGRASGGGVPARPATRPPPSGADRGRGPERAAPAAGGGPDLVDDIVVVDDGSDDDTAAAARGRGPGDAPARTEGGGKGQAMAVALAETDAELLVFLDADVESFSPHFVTGLLGPLLARRTDVALVKGFYDRPLHGSPTGGRTGHRARGPTGHRPAVPPSRLRPPAPRRRDRARRDRASTRPASPPATAWSWPCSSTWPRTLRGRASAQVDLGERIHRNRPLPELRPQATDVLGAALDAPGR